MKFALISVTDKTGVAEFAHGLVSRGFEILSTGNTAQFLEDNGITVTGISYFTGFPEILDGRVKTLHPKIHGGLLGIPEIPKHEDEMDQLGIKPIHVLAVNLYPFEATALKGALRRDVIENIDIGGPAMIRAAAKNAERVFVIVDPRDYKSALEAIDRDDAQFRERMRVKAFAHTAFYDSLIAQHLGAAMPESLNEPVTFGFRVKSLLRYGENPHQKAALLENPFSDSGVVKAERLWGKELSYNNILDSEAAWELACDLADNGPAGNSPVVIVKHGNPCGAAWAGDFAKSFVLARECDPISAFGGIVAVPGKLDTACADVITERGNFFEVVLCESLGTDALERFRSRGGWGQEVRILVVGARAKGRFLSIRGLRGGALIQEADTSDPVTWRVVTEKSPPSHLADAMKAAWIVVKHVKSNAIVVGGQDSLCGVGAGQMNRVQSVRLALEQAGEKAKGAVLASDAFFPFPDSIEAAAEAGIGAIVQPGGSKKDEEVIAAADRLGLAMVMTSVRHFRH